MDLLPTSSPLPLLYRPNTDTSSAPVSPAQADSPLHQNSLKEKKRELGVVLMPNHTSAAAQSSICPKRVEFGVRATVNQRKSNIHRRRRAESGEEEQHGQAYRSETNLKGKKSKR